MGVNGRGTTAGEHDEIRLVHGTPDEREWLGLVIKRTYTIQPDGTCRLAEVQEAVHEEAASYEDVDSPAVSALEQDTDLFAFKPKADVIVQGSAQTYGRPQTQTHVEVAVRGARRQIRVTGDRRLERGTGNELRFSAPEPFDTMPIRYERAFGGFDAVALKRHGDLAAKLFRDIRPEWNLDANGPYHYPRNPAGTGYLLAAE